jgi:Type IV secretion-system coupling protein DNA-binding domain
MSPVPLKLRDEEFFQHMQVLGGSGAGKTQALQTLVLHHIKSDASLVIIDSQGDLIDKVSHLEGIEDRVVLLTPKDIRHPPAINIFDIDRGRLGTYDEFTREQVTAGVIDTFDYLFTGLIGADLTAKQGVLFRYIARLMLAVPETMGRNATILDMIRLMDGTGPYEAAVQSLSDIPRDFFLRDFKDKTFDQTKEQIRYRLQAIIENPTLARLFTSPRTKIDLFEELNRGSIILIDTAKDFLKGASSHFGRIFISLVLQAVLERAVIPEEKRKPAFLVCDEAHEYFDDHIDDLLSEVRKYKLGCCFAHQHLEQCTPGLRASFASNTGIKMASGVSTSDARSLAPDMRTTPEFILSQPRLHFACHIRNVTPQAVSIPIEVGKLEAQPRLSEAAYGEFRQRNRERVSFSPEEIRPEPPRRPAPEPPREPPPPSPAEAATPEPPRSQRKRPKKHHGPLVGDIDTSA